MKYLMAIRYMLAFIFLWAFFDKLLGLGFATQQGSAWINGVSPTMGYLKFGTGSVTGEYFKMLAGNTVIDILFMGGLLGVGTSLATGKFMKLGGYGGAVMMLLIYISQLPLKNNPIIDQHIVYIALLLAIASEESSFQYSKKE